jgi:peptidoglycan/xylan/chitin deacetylase (PgdA/CDA1 family)
MNPFLDTCSRSAEASTEPLPGSGSAAPGPKLPPDDLDPRDAVSDVLVLCYHAVSERWSSELAVQPERLRDQLRSLVRRGYRGVTFTEAVQSPGTEKTLAVTFDDAYRSVLELGLPVLEELGLPGSVYAPTAFIGRDEPMSWPGIEEWSRGPDRGELVPLSWEQLRGLSAAGWEVGSHSRSHPRLTRLEDDELERELRESREDCERELGRPCTSIAYPFGDVDERVVQATEHAGYRAGGALPARFHAQRALEWPRVGVWHDDRRWRFRLKVSPLVRRVRSAR